jgi:hypothetical protein
MIYYPWLKKGTFSMKWELRHNKDFWAGMMLIGIGTAAMFIARAYPFGTARRMGPGYFPTVLGAILVLFGFYVVVKGLRSHEKIQAKWSPLALILLTLSLVLFGVLMRYAGFIPALMVLIFGSAAAGRGFRFVEVLLLTVVLTGISVAVFVWALGLPYPLIKGF